MNKGGKLGQFKSRPVVIAATITFALGLVVGLIIIGLIGRDNEDQTKNSDSSEATETAQENGGESAPDIRQYVSSGGVFEFAINEDYPTISGRSIAQDTFDLWDDPNYESYDQAFFLGAFENNYEIQFLFEYTQRLIESMEGKDLSFEETLTFMQAHKIYSLDLDYKSAEDLNSEIVRCDDSRNTHRSELSGTSFETIGRFNHDTITLIDSQGNQHSALSGDAFWMDIDNIMNKYEQLLPGYLYDERGIPICIKHTSALQSGIIERTRIHFAIPLETAIIEARFCDNCAAGSEGVFDLSGY